MRPIVIGLTGQSGGGKSHLAEIFADKGIPNIDADRISHEVTGEDPDCLAAIREAFGDDAFDGEKLNRRKLGKIVFSDPSELERLNRTVFPYIGRRIEEEVSRSGAPVVLLDAPTLYEAGADRLCAYVVAVCAPFEERLGRIIKRDGLTEKEALMRLRAQKDDAFYEDRADLVLHNNGTLDQFSKKAEQLAELLIRRFQPPAENKEDFNHE